MKFTPDTHISWKNPFHRILENEWAEANFHLALPERPLHVETASVLKCVTGLGEEDEVRVVGGGV